MQVEIKPAKDRPGFFTVIPRDSINTETVLDFQAKISPLLVKSTKNILLNLEDVDYISSAGIGALFSIKKFLRANGGDLLFCNLKPQIVKLFEIVKALPKESIFDNMDQVDEYLYKMMNQEIEKQKEKKKNV